MSTSPDTSGPSAGYAPDPSRPRTDPPAEDAGGPAAHATPAHTHAGHAHAGHALWGGRFSAKPDGVMQAINASIGIDQRLAAEDLAASRAHASMLTATGVISSADGAAIARGLAAIEAEIAAGAFEIRPELEDIHMHVEQRLFELIGEPARRLHTARSRNDQVATDFRLWVKRALHRARAGVEALAGALVARADAHADWAMPGFTHLQTAQPITLGHHLLAYAEMLGRDRARLIAAGAHLDECPLGAAALAGTGFPIDREMTAQALGFARPMANSLDAVASRDFAIEAVGAVALSAAHVSRLAEEIVLWTSAQFRFARLSDAWSTGSSIMPQKRNPDAAELIRAKAARIAAAHAALLGLIKALPLAYAKDLQEDKALTFEAFDAFELCCAAMTGMMETIAFDRDRLREAAGFGYATATDLADWLVRTKGMPFREAHHVTGAVVKAAEAAGAETLADLPLAAFQAIEPKITAAAIALLSVEQSLASRASYGGAAPAQVRAQVRRWTETIARWKEAPP